MLYIYIIVINKIFIVVGYETGTVMYHNGGKVRRNAPRPAMNTQQGHNTCKTCTSADWE